MASPVAAAPPAAGIFCMPAGTPITGGVIEQQPALGTQASLETGGIARGQFIEASGDHLLDKAAAGNHFDGQICRDVPDARGALNLLVDDRERGRRYLPACITRQELEQRVSPACQSSEIILRDSISLSGEPIGDKPHERRPVTKWIVDARLAGTRRLAWHCRVRDRQCQRRRAADRPSRPHGSSDSTVRTRASVSSGCNCRTVSASAYSRSARSASSRLAQSLTTTKWPG